MKDDDAIRELMVVIRAASADGCPVAHWSADAQEDIARTALRRWKSAERRAKGALTTPMRIEDLAKGLRDAYEPDRHLVGPLMEDYRHLASLLVAILSKG